MKNSTIRLFSILLITSLTVYSRPIFSNPNTITIQSKQLSLLVKELSVTPQTLSVSSSASNNKTFAINSNLTLWEIESNQPWLSVSKWSGSNNATITIIVTANTLATNRIGAITVSGAGVNSQIITITQNGTSTGIEEVSNKLMLSLYPNPSNGLFTITLDEIKGEEVSIKIVNSLGLIVDEQKVFVITSPYKKDLDISNHTKGIYYVTIESKKNKIVKPILLLK